MSEKEKHKNDGRRGFPWWLLVVGFALGVAATLLILESRRQPVSTNIVGDEGIQLMATRIIEGATETANAYVYLSMTTDPILATITAMAAESSIAQDETMSSEMDGFMLTATHLVQEATASAPASP